MVELDLGLVGFGNTSSVSGCKGVNFSFLLHQHVVEKVTQHCRQVHLGTESTQSQMSFSLETEKLNTSNNSMYSFPLTPFP